MRTARPDRRGGSSRPRDRSGDKRSPGKTGVDYLYGRNPINEALDGRRTIHRLLIGSAIDGRGEAIATKARSMGVAVESVDKASLDNLAPAARHGGMVLETSTFPYADADEVLLTDGPVIALDHLQDPQNAGTLIRSALAFGATGVLIPKDRSFQVTPTVVGTSSGATERIPIAQVTNLTQTINRSKESGWWVAGLDNGPNSTEISHASCANPLILVIGSEGTGMSRSLQQQCDYVLRIDQSEAIDSVNAAIAGSIALYLLSRSLTD